MNKHHSSKSPPTPTSQLLFFLEPRQLNQSPPISGFFHPVRHRAHSLPRIGSVFWVIPILLGVNMLIQSYTYLHILSTVSHRIYLSISRKFFLKSDLCERLTWDFGKWKHTLEHNLGSIYEISHHETSSFKRGHGCHGYPIPIKDIFCSWWCVKHPWWPWTAPYCRRECFFYKGKIPQSSPVRTGEMSIPGFMNSTFGYPKKQSSGC